MVQTRWPIGWACCHQDWTLYVLRVTTRVFVSCVCVFACVAAARAARLRARSQLLTGHGVCSCETLL